MIENSKERIMALNLKSVTALVLGLFLVGGCGTDYRVISVINTDKPSTMTWEGKRITWDPHAKYYYINPYTYNPSDPGVYEQVAQRTDSKAHQDPNYTWRFSAQSSWDSSAFNAWWSAKTNTDLASSYTVIMINRTWLEASNALFSASNDLAGLPAAKAADVPVLQDVTNSLSIASSRLHAAMNDPGSASNNVYDAITWINGAEKKLTSINPDAKDALDFTVSAFARANDTLAVCSEPTTSAHNNQQYMEVYAPYYWKASESTNLTGLTDDDRKYYRNELQNAILRAAKESSEDHLSELKGTENSVNGILGAATIGLSGGAAVASRVAAKALAVAAAGTAGARSLFNDQVYRNTFVESTIALIENDQATFLNTIKTVYQTNDIYHYTVEGAILDAKEYEMRGSFYHGLALLQQAVQSTLNGNTNGLVPFNQLTTAMPKIANPDLALNIVWPTTAGAKVPPNVPFTTNIMVNGSSFSQAIWGSVTVVANTPAANVTAGSVSATLSVPNDDQMILVINIGSFKAPAAAGVLPTTKDQFTLTLAYSLQGISRQLSLPLSIGYQ